MIHLEGKQTKILSRPSLLLRSQIFLSSGALNQGGFGPSAIPLIFTHHNANLVNLNATKGKLPSTSHKFNAHIIVDNLSAELMPPTTLYIWAQSGKLTSQKNAEICPRFFSFNSSATLFLDNLTHPHTIELTKFGMVCDNIIILMELVCKRLNSLDYNPELSTFHHSSSLGLDLFTETLWIGESGRYILHVERKQFLLIFGIISGCC